MGNFNLDNYVPVHERLAAFYKDFPTGRVLTELVEHDRETGFVIFKALVFREKDDAEPSATGHTFEERNAGYVNKTSYIENAETSAVGRALALLGYEITRGIASREEMQKVERYEQSGASGGGGSFGNRQQSAPPKQTNGGNSNPQMQNPNAPASEKQIGALRNICKGKNLSEIDVCLEYSGDAAETFEQLTKAQASEAISQLGGGGR